MKENITETSVRKKEHLELSLKGNVSFREKTNGFAFYEFRHSAVTEVDINKISFEQEFLGIKIKYPFLISCMTGGISEAENINSRLATAANELGIPIGVGSQRQALENDDHLRSFKIVRGNAPSVPVLGNIGAAQLVKMKSFDPVTRILDMIEGNALVVHLNPLQELVQKNGEPDFRGLLKKTEKLVKQVKKPVIFKEVGAGISKEAAENLLLAGVKGIDVAGAGGTSWSGIEYLRNKENEQMFWDWGLPTSFCIKEVYKLKKKYKFTLIGSGGINNPFDMAKAFALGADMAASARIVLKKLDSSGVDGVVGMVNDWFNLLKKIMFLTGSANFKQLRNRKLIRKDNFY